MHEINLLPWRQLKLVRNHKIMLLFFVLLIISMIIGVVYIRLNLFNKLHAAHEQHELLIQKLLLLQSPMRLLFLAKKRCKSLRSQLFIIHNAQLSMSSKINTLRALDKILPNDIVLTKLQIVGNYAQIIGNTTLQNNFIMQLLQLSLRNPTLIYFKFIHNFYEFKLNFLIAN